MAIEKYTTPENLDIYVEQTPGIKTLSAEIVVKTGSVHEPDELAGASHALEHCVHLRTPQFPKKTDIDEYADEHAFYRNANTHYTRTKYVTAGLEPDAMFNLLGQVVFQPQFGEEETAHEMQAIRREAKTGLDKIDFLAPVFSDAVLFGKPFGRRVIGYSDRLNFTEQQLTDYYRPTYLVSNMSLLAVGDISMQEVVALAERHFDISKHGGNAPDRSPINTPLHFPRQHSFGYVREESESARLNLTTAMPPEFIDTVRNQQWAYLAARHLLSRSVFHTLRSDLGLSYDGRMSFSTGNHKLARRLYTSVTVEPGKVEEAFTALHGVMSVEPASYTDKDLQRALSSLRLDAAASVDDVLNRIDDYSEQIAHDREPIAQEEYYWLLEATTVDDVRIALTTLLATWRELPKYELVTGPRAAIGDRQIIDQSTFA